LKGASFNSELSIWKILETLIAATQGNQHTASLKEC
jgi:hypothetical protein